MKFNRYFASAMIEADLFNTEAESFMGAYCGR